MSKIASITSIEIAARIWCDPEMSKIVMDKDAVIAIALILDDVISKQCPCTCPDPSVVSFDCLPRKCDEQGNRND